MLPTTSTVDPRHLAYMSDCEFMQVLFSSADYFPGLYRYTLGTLPFPHDNLNHQQLFTAFMHQQHYQKQWKHQQWFAHQDEVHYRTMKARQSRNQERDDAPLAEDLDNRAYRRYVSPSLYALTVMDIVNPVQELMCGFTYMMMGSHIHFEQDAFYVGYDNLMHTWAIEVKVPFFDTCEYIETIMTSKDIAKLFLHSRVIAHLLFEDGPMGTVCTSLEALAEWHEFSSPIFAAPLGYHPPLPIRYAKLIGVSDVTATKE
ncbi:hypothetical protein E4H12_09050 [Candidatus Thorarchaeota archaeon]|nr:MAG: hypothetical protein E4H12_09050 [Candidatus Thorarchaeota archaeon]